MLDARTHPSYMTIRGGKLELRCCCGEWSVTLLEPGVSLDWALDLHRTAHLVPIPPPDVKIHGPEGQYYVICAVHGRIRPPSGQRTTYAYEHTAEAVKTRHLNTYHQTPRGLLR